MTPIEFYYAIQEANKRDEVQYHTTYEVARHLARHIWNAQGRFLKRTLEKDEEVETFYWEKKEKKVQTIEEMKLMMKSIYNTFLRRQKRQRNKTEKSKRPNKPISKRK